MFIRRTIVGTWETTGWPATHARESQEGPVHETNEDVDEKKDSLPGPCIDRRAWEADKARHAAHGQVSLKRKLLQGQSSPMKRATTKTSTQRQANAAQSTLHSFAGSAPCPPSNLGKLRYNHRPPVRPPVLSRASKQTEQEVSIRVPPRVRRARPRRAGYEVVHPCNTTNDHMNEENQRTPPWRRERKTRAAGRSKAGQASEQETTDTHATLYCT